MKLKFLFVLLVLFNTISFSQASTNLKIKNSVFDQGGNASLSSNYKIICAVGQTGTIGNSSNIAMVLYSGFINPNLSNSYLMIKSIVAIAQGWNLISIPLALENMEVSSIFPYAASSAYRYNNGYSIATSFENGSGYWIKFGSGVSTVELSGTRVSQNINLSGGWNIIGLNEKNIAVTNITTVPAGIITSNFFGYSNGYIIPDTLKSGKGYWIKTNQGGYINIPSLSKRKESTITKNDISKEWPKIELTDANGNIGVVYLSNTSANPDMYELPPLPPKGIFDFRFSSDRLVETLNSESKEIKISSADYPVELKIVGTDIKISDILGGKIINVLLKDGESITINNSVIEALRIEGKSVPTEFALYQNYPNPFNSLTTISYALPVETKVVAEIYDVLGSKVITIFDGIQKPGTYKIEWNADNNPSGIYFCTLTTKNFIKTRKLILMK